MPRSPALLAAFLALAACDWPVPDRDDAAATGPWPVLVPDAALGIASAAPAPQDVPDLAQRAADLAARAEALRQETGIDAETAARLATAGG